MRDDQKFLAELETDFEISNPEDTKAEARLAKLKELENSEEYRAKKKQSDSTTLATQAAAIAKQKRLQEFDRFDPDFVDAYKLDRNLKKMPKLESEAQKEEPLD